MEIDTRHNLNRNKEESMKLELMPPLFCKPPLLSAQGWLFSFCWQEGSRALYFAFPLFEVSDNCVFHAGLKKKAGIWKGIGILSQYVGFLVTWKARDSLTVSIFLLSNCLSFWSSNRTIVNGSIRLSGCETHWKKTKFQSPGVPLKK